MACGPAETEERKVETAVVPASRGCLVSFVLRHSATISVCGLLLVAVLTVFGQTVRHDFVNFDDDQYAYDTPNPSRGLTLRGVVWAFTHRQCGNWHPLTGISHGLDYQVYGLWAGGHHLTNVFLHAASAIVLLLVMQRMTGALWPSALVAAVFAIHPLHVESVAWVSERKDVLSGLFFMLTLSAYEAYVRRRSSGNQYGRVLLFFALGLMCKPTLVTLPLVLLVLDYWPLCRFRDASDADWRIATALLIEKIPLLALAAASSLVTLLAQKDVIALSHKFSLDLRIANAIVSYAGYLGDTFYPAGLAAFYPFPGHGLPQGVVIGSLLVLAGISAAVIACRRNRPYLVTGWLWFLGVLVPMIGLVHVGGQARADRYTYLPQTGLAIMVAWAVRDVTRAWSWRRLICGTASMLVLCVLVVCAWRQTTFWHDSETLWTHVLESTRNNAVAHNNLGKFLVNGRANSEVVSIYLQTLRVDPRYSEAHEARARAAAFHGRPDEAIEQFRKALDIYSGYALAQNNLGNALCQCGEFGEAAEHYRVAVEICPDDIQVRDNLGLALYQQHKVEEAIAAWRESIRLAPKDAYTLGLLAWVLATTADPSLRNNAEAMELGQQAAQLSKERNPPILDTLGAAYAGAGRYREAVETARRALALASQQGDGALSEAIRTRIKLYEAGRPYREAPTPSRHKDTK